MFLLILSLLATFTGIGKHRTHVYLCRLTPYLFMEGHLILGYCSCVSCMLMSIS